MIPTEVESYLLYPFYRLNHINNLDDFEGFEPEEARLTLENYPNKTLRKIIKALTWVKNNPGANLCGMEQISQLGHTNDQVYRYSVLMLEELEKVMPISES